MQIKQCCCCCSLKTGVLALGWFEIVFAVFEVTVSSVALTSNTKSLNVTGIGEFFYEEGPKSLPYSITSGIISLLAYILLLFGTIHGNHFLLIPYLIVEKAGTVVIILVVFIGFPIALSTDEMIIHNQGVTVITIIIVSSLVYIGLRICFGMCVSSLYRDIRQSSSSNENPLMEALLTINDDEPSTPV